MKTTVALLSLTLSFTVFAQKYEADTKTQESLTEAYYDIISGPIGQQRDFDRLRNLFHPRAMLTYCHYDDAGKAQLMFMDVEEYIGNLDYLDKKGFYEKELFNTSESFGPVIQSFSTYAFDMEDKTAEGRGITSYNLFDDGERYWILSMFWTMENEKNKIPKKYLN